MPRQMGVRDGITGLRSCPAKRVVDFSFLSGEQRGQADANLSLSQLRQTEGTSTATGIGHPERSFLSSQGVNLASQVAIPVHSIQGQIQMGVKQQHGRFLKKAGKCDSYREIAEK
jgi:hypothetical protein